MCKAKIPLSYVLLSQTKPILICLSEQSVLTYGSTYSKYESNAVSVHNEHEFVPLSTIYKFPPLASLTLSSFTT